MLAIYGRSGRHFVLFRIPAVASLVQSVIFGFSDSDITMTIRVYRRVACMPLVSPCLY